jgi:hypothetical protein
VVSQAAVQGVSAGGTGRGGGWEDGRHLLQTLECQDEERGCSSPPLPRGSVAIEVTSRLMKFIGTGFAL